MATTDLENPFSIPSDGNVFELHEKEQQKLKQERIEQQRKKVHEKSTFASSQNQKVTDLLKSIEESENGDIPKDTTYALAITKTKAQAKEKLSEYIAKKREMFLLQYALGVKQDEIQKLEAILADEERKLGQAEQQVEKDAIAFDEFLKENGKKSVEAIKIAEAETKAKLEKVSEIKKIHAKIVSIKSEISSFDDHLKECKMYQKFLFALAPDDWKNKIEEKKNLSEIEKEKAVSLSGASTVSFSPLGDPWNASCQKANIVSSGSQKVKSKGRKTGRKYSTSITQDSRTALENFLIHYEAEMEDADEEPELYFTDAQQLLDIYSELEEQCLSLIQHSQDTEEALENVKQMTTQAKVHLEQETETLQQQISLLENSIKWEEQKAEEFQLKAQMFSFGKFKEDDQEKNLQDLNHRILAVYRACIGENEANISTLQMLTSIENRLEELYEMLETMPQEKVMIAQKAREKEHRLRLRQEKIRAQREYQEQRMRKALERAQALPKKKMGRKLMFRSEPPREKPAEEKGHQHITYEDDELAFFFT